MLKKFWYWLTTSSIDPTRYSLTIRSALVGLITAISMIAGVAHLQIGDLTPIIDPIISIVQSFLTVLSSLAFIYGLVRKLIITGNGEHPSI